MVKMRFRIIRGQHVEGPTRVPDPKNPGLLMETAPRKVYNADGSGDGSVIVSDVDLVRKFGEEKFRLLGEPRRRKVVEEPVEEAEEVEIEVEEEEKEAETEEQEVEETDLDSMSVKELREFAEARGIDLSGLRKRNEITFKIQRAIED